MVKLKLTTMKKNYFLLLLVLLTMAFTNTSAQIELASGQWEINRPGLEIPPLIFSEYRGDVSNFNYVEITNVGQDPIDLGNFSVVSAGTYTKLEGSTDSVIILGNRYNIIPLEGTLEAGGSYVMTNVWDAWFEDGLPRHNIAVAAQADMLWRQDESTGNTATYQFLGKPEWEAYGYDTISTYYNHISGSSSGYYLEYKFEDSEGNRDSTLIDNANISMDPYESFGNCPGCHQGRLQTPVAGIVDAIDQYVLVRKSTVTEGTMDWHLSRGTDHATSEWLLIPVFLNKFDAFTTVGTHGNYSPNYVANSPDKVIVDAENKTLTVPWETVRGETINREFTLGDGMGWSYTENETDSAYTNVRDGDTLSLYAVGETIDQLDLTIQVTDPAADLAIAFPTRYYQVIRDWESGTEYGMWVDYYDVTQGLDTDSVYNVAFGTRIDTLLKYMVKPEKAAWEVVTGDESRADVKEGDVLKVTSEDGTVVKEYVIMVDDYEPSENAALSMITWPDVDPDIYWQWESDTIPGFDPNGASYFIQLEEGTSNIPALQFKTQDVNAKIEVTRATDINGSLEQRTTVAKITAEDGISTKTINIEFRIKTVPVQPNFAEPFISEMVLGMNFAYNLEIYNPGNQPLDLNKYMIVTGLGDDNLNDAVGRLLTDEERNIYFHHHVPGMRFKHDLDLAAYAAEPGFLVPDNVTSTIVQPGDVWVDGTVGDGGWPGGRFYPDRYHGWFTDGDHLDFIWYGWSEEAPDSNPADSINDEFNLNPFGISYMNRYRTPTMVRPPNTSLFLLKILNDTILAGTKDITDPFDYEIVDRFQSSPDVYPEFWCAGRNMVDPHWNGWSVRRNPDVWRGVTERGEGFGDNFGQSAENAEWVLFNRRDEGMENLDMIDQIGWHSMDPVLTFVSTVTSTRLLVTPGYEGDQTITGSVDGLKVTEITAILDKADPGQMLVFLNGADTLGADDALAGDMKLVVTSADLQNSTSYTLVNSPLDADNLLKAVDGSGLTVSLSENAGIVAGVELGSTINALVEKLEVPALAVMNIVDGNNNLVSMQSLDYDSVMVDAVVGEDVYLEVVAQNGDAALYSLDFGISASDAVLFSDILAINQDVKAVTGVPVGIAVDAFMQMVYPNEMATAELVDKKGFVRTAGVLYSDDAVEVTSEDNSVTVVYRLNFVGQVNQAPEASIEGATEAVVGEVLNYVATVTDDGLPVGSTLTYLWEITAGNATIANPDQKTTDVTFSEAGSFELSFTASDGELSTKVSTTITTAVGVDLYDMSSVKVYPNPASDLLYVEFGNVNMTDARIRMLDISGRLMYDVLNVDEIVEIGLENIDNGIYFISIEIENQVSVRKLTILK
ncbi:MAG TPA: T9SS type A sorting domain-containing protein [Bacteroides sp.]|nr:T9SS type A sorting domain-containing protein [Bacteroides sp.]